MQTFTNLTFAAFIFLSYFCESQSLHTRDSRRSSNTGFINTPFGKGLIATAIGGISIASMSFLFWSNPKPFENADSIPIEYFKEKKEIKAIVVKITDGDTVRVRHVTNSRTSSEFTGNLKDHTIAVRLAAVDAPETAKFGNAGQALGEAAKSFVSDKLLNKRVTIKLLSKDHYGRVLGLVKYRDNTILPDFLCSKKDLSEQLLSKGLAVVYRQGGAQYDGSIDRWNSIEKQAIRAKRGIWMNGEKNAELPSDYKRKTKKEVKKVKTRV